MNKRLLIISIFVIIVGYIILYVYNNQYHIDRGLPIIDIELKNVDLEDVYKDKNIEYLGNRISIYNDNKIVLKNKIGFKGRGNFTWTLDKKSYRISFNEKTKVLDLPETKKYVLLGNQTDSSLLKNDFTYTIAKRLGLNYSFTGEFVELYIDKYYMGNYYITPKVGISKNVVDLKNEEALLVELDNSYYKEEKHYFQSSLGDYLVLKDSNSKDTNNFKVFEEKYNMMEQCIQNQSFECLNDTIDVDSFIKYYIISEFAENPDSLQSSLFFYTDGKEDKIHIGPIWDFDIAYGLKPQYASYEGSLIKDDLINEKETSKLFYYLLKIEEFENRVIDYWNNTASQIYKEEIDNLEKKYNSIKKSGESNNKRWKLDNYKRSYSTFKYWVDHRYEFLNEKIGNE